MSPISLESFWGSSIYVILLVPKATVVQLQTLPFSCAVQTDLLVAFLRPLITSLRGLSRRMSDPSASETGYCIRIHENMIQQLENFLSSGTVAYEMSKFYFTLHDKYRSHNCKKILNQPICCLRHIRHMCSVVLSMNLRCWNSTVP